MIWKKFRFGILTLLLFSAFSSAVVALVLQCDPWETVGTMAQPAVQSKPVRTNLMDVWVVPNTGLVAAVWSYNHEPNLKKDRLIASCWSLPQEKLLWSTAELEGYMGAFSINRESKLDLLANYRGEEIVYEIDLEDGKAEMTRRAWPDSLAEEHEGPHEYGDYRVFARRGTGEVEIFRRTGPEQWWGVVWLPAFWLAVGSGIALLWRLRRDRRALRKME